jgi:Holliday junction DNA helicase RuvA
VIAHLRGRIFEKHPNRLVLDINGVGYDVFVPLSTFYGLGEPGSETALRIHTHVREDAFVLYGFGTLLEQELFERLIGVSGIGPKVALAVLSGIEPLDLIRAIERGDLARLTAIPGVGKKTSERIVLELKDRLPRAQVAAVAAGVAPPETSSLRDDLLSALVNLGYHRPLAEKAVESAIKAQPDGGFERTLKQALRELAMMNDRWSPRARRRRRNTAACGRGDSTKIGRTASRKPAGRDHRARVASRSITSSARTAGPRHALAHVIANEMGVQVKATSGPAVEKPGDLVGIVTISAREVLFIDEVTGCRRSSRRSVSGARRLRGDIVIGQGLGRAQ